jgi:hypothetical protein
MQVCQQTLSDEMLKALKQAWHQFLNDRDWAGLKSAIDPYSTIQTPLDNKESEGWLWFTRSAVSRIINGFGDNEWMGLASSAAECGNIIAMEWLASAYLFKSKSNSFDFSRDTLRKYVKTVFDSPLRPGASKLANNVLWASNMGEFNGVFDDETLSEAREIADSTGPQPGWLIGDFEMRPLCVSKNTLVQLRDYLIAAWTFNISTKAPIEKGYSAVLQLTNQDDHLVIYVDNGYLSIKKENELGSIILCHWQRRDIAPIHLINKIVDWIESRPSELWPMMHLALTPSIEMNISESLDFNLTDIGALASNS